MLKTPETSSECFEDASVAAQIFWDGGGVRLTRICRGCGIAFEIGASQVRKGRGVYHNRACYRAAMVAARQVPDRVCRRCGKQWHMPPSAVRNGQGRFCSNACHWAAKGEAEDLRFWARVRRGSPAACWPFVGPCHPDGYGHVKLRGTTMFASRKAYILTHGELRADQYVGHGCNFPPCCNPDHLYVTDIRGNLADRNAQLRQVTYPPGHQLLTPNSRWRAAAGASTATVRLCRFRFDPSRGVLVGYELPSGRHSELGEDEFLKTFARVS